MENSGGKFMEKSGGKRELTFHRGFWTIFGGTVIVLAVAGLLANLGDIKRYIKISTM
jgi:hypothetical protein